MFEKLLSVTVFVCLVLAECLGECLAESKSLNLTQYPGELCNSKCVKGRHRVCYFEWNLELYQAMGSACGKCDQGVTADCFKPQCIIGDGFQKGVMSINRMIPGPPLHLCEGDKVIIDVKNIAPGTAAAIHWHGLHMVDTPFMDGVPFTTQCPILYGSTFRYQFYATQPGTHFYHSHSGMHRLNGQYGALIVRQPDKNNLQIREYDYDLPEHYILISDWKHGYGENSFPGIPKGDSYPDSLLINGRGTYVDKETFMHNKVPVTIFYVLPGSRFKFNLINSMSLMDSIQLQVENHNMVVIATDSYDVKAFKINTLVMNAGERYDIVIEANKPTGDFWIRIQGYNKMLRQPTESFALLRYVNSDWDYKKAQPPFPAYDETYPIGIILNSPKATCFNNEDKEYCAADLTAIEQDIDLVTRKPDYKFTFSFLNNPLSPEKAFFPDKYRRFDNPERLLIAEGIINNISHIFPPQPILTQYYDVDKNLICDKSDCPEKCEGESTRKCVYIVKVKTNSIVEMTLYDKVNFPGLHHPFHLHGHRFALMGITNDTTDLKKAIEFASKYRKSRPVWKDTVSVPQHGLAVARFRANNPGIWLMHCHYELHLETGMAMLFQVGEPEEWIEAPEDFPKCGDYMPQVEKDYF